MRFEEFYSRDGRPHRRYVVVGTSGSGKTTLARAIAEHLGVEHIELDALHWLPDWEMRPVDDFRRLVRSRLDAESWVVDGNYSKVRDIVWSRADAVIWLDLPRPVVMWRVFWRTARRTLLRERLWNGNVESLRTALFDSESIVRWAWNTFEKRRREYPDLLSRPENQHLDLFRIRDSHHEQIDVSFGRAD
ncbi:MAG: AAA family ATPase [Myxococcota bacterium]